jgi:hypothetical protein
VHELLYRCLLTGVVAVGSLGWAFAQVAPPPLTPPSDTTKAIPRLTGKAIGGTGSNDATSGRRFPSRAGLLLGPQRPSPNTLVAPGISTGVQ